MSEQNIEKEIKQVQDEIRATQSYINACDLHLKQLGELYTRLERVLRTEHLSATTQEIITTTQHKNRQGEHTIPATLQDISQFQNLKNIIDTIQNDFLDSRNGVLVQRQSLCDNEKKNLKEKHEVLEKRLRMLEEEHKAHS